MPRPVRCGDGERRVDVVDRNTHVAGEQVAGADRDDAHGMAGAGHGARDRADSAVAADRDHHVGAVGERLLGACAAVLVELRVDEFHVGQSLVTAELFDVRAPLGGLRLGRVHDEDVMHLIVVAFDELLRQALVTAGAQGERHGDDEDDDAGDDGYGDDGG